MGQIFFPFFLLPCLEHFRQRVKVSIGRSIRLLNGISSACAFIYSMHICIVYICIHTIVDLSIYLYLYTQRN
jgi:hypothetical protein